MDVLDRHDLTRRHYIVMDNATIHKPVAVRKCMRIEGINVSTFLLTLLFEPNQRLLVKGEIWCEVTMEII